MSFGIVGMLTARSSFRTKMFFQGMGLSQDKVALAVTDFRKGKMESSDVLFRAQQTMQEMEKNITLREEMEKKQANKEQNKQANLQAHLAKQTKREKALLTKPMKIEIGKVNLAKMSEEELKKELGKLALLKQNRELEAIRLKDEETRRLEREQREKIEAEKAAQQAAIDKKKTEEKKAKDMLALKQRRAQEKKASELTMRLIEQQKRRDEMFARQEAARKAADARKNNLVNSIQEMYKALGL